MSNTKPEINVTPLIDVLLVLLIIFMVISPAKPTNFRTKIPQEPKANALPNPHTLIVELNNDLSLNLNKEEKIATLAEPEKLIQKLSQIFRQRTENLAYAQGVEFKQGSMENERIEKTVFIKAPRSMDYGKVVNIIDAVKIAGANPISLQIDDLH